MRGISFLSRSLLLYFITNPHTHVSGIYYLPRAVISYETTLTINRIDTLSNTLSGAGFCAFDRQREIVWVKNMMKYQGRGDKNVKSAAHHLIEDLHGSPLTHEFVAAYPAVKAEIDDRVSKGYPGLALLIPDSRSLIPDPESRILKPELRADARIPCGEFESVLLTAEEIQKLKTRLNGQFEAFIHRLDRYSQTNPRKFKTYKSHYAVILSWADKDEQKVQTFETKEEKLERRNREIREEVARRVTDKS